jgi:hypothetical protein
MVTQTKVKTLKQQTSHISNNTQTNLDPAMQLLDTASTPNVKNIECFQSKAFRMIMDESWYVSNTVIRKNLQTPTVKEEIRH